MPLNASQRWGVEYAARLGYHVMHDDGRSAEFGDGRQFTQDLNEAQARAAELNADAKAHLEAEAQGNVS